jgi:uncharacterized damage-inducible protein DinB
MRLSWMLVAAASVALAQDPLSADLKMSWGSVKNYVVRSAEKMPEENYSFKPVPEVRSFGQILGHVADANYMFCSAVLGEKREPAGVEKTKTSKADLIAALKDSVSYCDKAYDGLTDATAAQMVKMFGRERTRLGLLLMNAAHDWEHYGNLVTYLRIKGLVPPSSEPRKK